MRCCPSRTNPLASPNSKAWPGPSAAAATTEQNSSAMAKVMGTSATQHLTSMGGEERSAAPDGARWRQKSRITSGMAAARWRRRRCPLHFFPVREEGRRAFLCAGNWADDIGLSCRPYGHGMGALLDLHPKFQSSRAPIITLFCSSFYLLSSLLPPSLSTVAAKRSSFDPVHPAGSLRLLWPSWPGRCGEPESLRYGCIFPTLLD